MLYQLTETVIPVKIYNPYVESISEIKYKIHSRVLGLTPTGRVTVEALQLNRDGVVNLRRVLYSIGEHPPSDVLKDE